MPFQDYRAFFAAASGQDRKPYDYQIQLANGPCESRLITVPTGLGKTAAVVLAWLWNRCGQPAADKRARWPRRLVYCLPMRTLVEQTQNEARRWILRLARLHTKPRDGSELRWLALQGIHLLMGGEETEQWDLHPERPAILIGTQDMLLSRTLNRGYGMSRYRWPMHFALLNNDCLWIFDETQLMGVGVETSAQLDGFRHLAQWTQGVSSKTWWMSATLDDARLSTVDHPAPDRGWPKIELTPEERLADGVRLRFEAKKPVQKAEFKLSPATKDAHAKELAQVIKDKHVEGTLTLVVVNRVNRARKLYAALRDKKPGLNPNHIALIHSRFRPIDRKKHQDLLFYGEGNRIVIATQAVEAGVDVSARLLITELAPWSSLVQRIGRCNRKGDIANAEFLWVDIQPKDDKDDLALPYTLDDLKKARTAIQSIQDVGPQSLSSVRVQEASVIRPVIRRRDLLDLFDTTPDICGQDLDISRYIRDGEDSDVQFFWREIATKADPVNEPEAQRHELCRVPLGEAVKFLKKNKGRVWQWDGLTDAWQKADFARPGGVYLISTDVGGYDDDLGWTSDPKSKPTPHPPSNTEPGGEAHGKDPQSFARYWLSYDKHVQGVVTTMKGLAQALALDASDAALLATAALWHDTGKVHKVFQGALRFGPHQPADLDILYAKSKNPPQRGAVPRERQGFRHELASALVWLAGGPGDEPERDLIAYIIAAHHGKVRLSLRALPNEKGDASSPDRLFARGIWDKDVIDSIPRLTTQPVPLDLSIMQMGEGPLGPSWLARTLALRDRFGPFRLAYMETLLRAADMRTSASEAPALHTSQSQS